jgi:peptidyl-prolyl cis-trans isomerase C
MKKIILCSFVMALFIINLNATVYATVNGEEVVDQDIAVLMRAMKGVTFEELPTDAKHKIVEQAIERKILTTEAIKSGIKEKQEYHDEIKRIKDEINKNGGETSETLNRIESDLALEMWMKKAYDSSKVDAEEVKDYHDKNADKFIYPILIKARHILLKNEQEAKDVIKDIESLSGQKLADKFAELATIKSAGIEGQGGGELGWFSANQMVKPFADAAFALKKGEMTKIPVLTQFGFHVILVEDIKASEKAKFDDVKAQIEVGLKMEKFRIKVSSKAKELRESTNVIYL